jgi:transposase InsO family protein
VSKRLCALAGVSRAGYYRHLRVSLPRQEETVVRDAIQRVSLANRRYGYRRIAAQLRRDGLVVNHKRAGRLGPEAAREFFETNFVPVRIPREGAHGRPPPPLVTSQKSYFLCSGGGCNFRPCLASANAPLVAMLDADLNS